MPSLSVTGIGAIVSIILMVLKLFGVHVPDEMGGQITEAISTLVGAALLVWGQLRRPELIAGLVHRK